MICFIFAPNYYVTCLSGVMRRSSLYSDTLPSSLPSPPPSQIFIAPPFPRLPEKRF